MGLTASSQRFSAKNPAEVLLVGLDASGKTTILSHLHAPYQFFPTDYTNSLLAQQQPKATASRGSEGTQPDAAGASGGEAKTEAAAGEEKTGDGADNGNNGDKAAAAIIPTPDLAPFTDIILPTSGVQLSEFAHQGQHVRAWDLSGQGKFRPLWEEYYNKAAGIVFVVDGKDKARIGIARREFDEMMSHPMVARQKTPVLLFLNNYETEDADGSDLLASTTVTVEHMQHIFGTKRRKSAVRVAKVDAISGKGVHEGFGWLLDRMGKTA